MLISAADVQGYSIRGTDGEIGQVDRLFFDDAKWTIRYLVLDTGKWLPGRRVLISPAAVEGIDSAAERIQLTLTTERIRNSPDIDTDKPVSRQQEIALSAYYGYGPYWGGTGLWGSALYPPGVLAPPPPAGAALAPPPAVGLRDATAAVPPQDANDPHLRSTKEVAGYHVAAIEGEIGHVDDFLIDDQTWEIRFLVIDTSNWPGGRSVLISPQHVRQVDWPASVVHVDLTADHVRASPEYDRTAVLDRAHDHSPHGDRQT